VNFREDKGEAHKKTNQQERGKVSRRESFGAKPFFFGTPTKQSKDKRIRVRGTEKPQKIKQAQGGRG